MLRNIFSLIILIMLLACTSTPILQDFDSEAWKKDVEGCNNLRINLVDELINNRSELVGLGQNDIIKVLGKPNRHELYSRHKKAFIYTVKGSVNCPKDSGKASRLVIRFDALERTKDVILYK